MESHGAKQAKATAHIVLVEDNAGDVYLVEKALKARHITYDLTRYADGEQGLLALSGHEQTRAERIKDNVFVSANLADSSTGRGSLNDCFRCRS
jgi:CheY-like chemotaxis protein